MPQTFEELIGPEFDHIFQGSLFLSAGDADSAERLLTATLIDSFRAFRRGPPERAQADFARWMDDRLVRQFVSSLPDDESSMEEDAPAHRPPPSSATAGSGSLDADKLLHGAGKVPARARAALWLVLFRRASYAHAAETLGLSGERLQELLRHRATLLSVVGGGGHGAAGDAANGSEG